LSHIKQNSIINLVFIKFTISFGGGNRDYSPRAPKIPSFSTENSKFKRKKKVNSGGYVSELNIASTHRRIVTSRIGSIT